MRSLDFDPCAAYPFSNDRWTRTQTMRLKELLAKQDPEQKDRATALVVGSGGLPYILGYLGASRIVVLDRAQSVIDSVKMRISTLAESSSWQDYRERVEPKIADRRHGSFIREYRMAAMTELLGDFSVARAEASRIEVVGREGNIAETLPALGSELADEDRLATMINITNVADYVRAEHTHARRAAIARLVGCLPLAESAVIVESGPGIIYATAQRTSEYFEQWNTALNPIAVA